MVQRTATQGKMFITLYSRKVHEFGQWQTRWTGFYISSEPQCMEADRACDVRIYRQSHAFLEKNTSWVNVGATVEHYAGELRERVGFIEDGAREEVLRAIDECGLLPRQLEVAILNAARGAISRVG